MIRAPNINGFLLPNVSTKKRMKTTTPAILTMPKKPVMKTDLFPVPRSEKNCGAKYARL